MPMPGKIRELFACEGNTSSPAFRFTAPNLVPLAKTAASPDHSSASSAVHSERVRGLLSAMTTGRPSGAPGLCMPVVSRSMTSCVNAPCSSKSKHPAAMAQPNDQ